MRRPTRAVLVAGPVVGVLIGAGLPAAQAVPVRSAVRSATGTGCAGVLVVVEPRGVPQGGGSRVGCAGNPSSGLEALRQAGFGVTLGTGPYGGGFVCALDGAPAQGCGLVDDDTYWSYWYMVPGTSRWIYSQTGAAGRHPSRGGIEAWVWQSGGAVEAPAARSAIAPPPKTTPTPPPTPRPTSQPSLTSGGRTGQTSGPAGSGPGAGSGSDTIGGQVASVSGPSRTPAGAGAGAGAGMSVTGVRSRQSGLAAQPLADRQGGGGEPGGWPWWTGVAGLVVAVLFGLDTVRRVRRGAPAGGAATR